MSPTPPTFVRFVSGSPNEDARWLTGIFSTARELRDNELLTPAEAELITCAFDWFNANLPCPPFSRKLQRREWSEDAVAWFRSNADLMIARIWDIISILREASVPVMMVTTTSPGQIVYEDDFQVVAETVCQSRLRVRSL